MYKKILILLCLFVLQIQLAALTFAFVSIGPFLCFCFVWTGHFLAGWAFYAFAPLLLLVGPMWLYLFAVAELNLAKQVGEDQILWCNTTSTLLLRFLPFRTRVSTMYFLGWDAFRSEVADIPLIGAFLSQYGDLGPESARVAASRAYCQFLRNVVKWLRPRNLWVFSMLAIVVSFQRLRSFLRLWFKLVLPMIVVSFTIVMEVDNDTILDFVGKFLAIIWSFFKWSPSTGWLFGRWIKLSILSLFIDIVLWSNSMNFYLSSQYSQRLSGRLSKVSVFKDFIMHSVNFIDSLRLPAYIRTGFRLEPTIQALQESKDLLASLGWPVTVNLKEPNLDASENTRDYLDWLISGTDFATGVRNLTEKIDNDLIHLKAHAEVYRRTESYATVENELEATSRYFVRPRYEYPTLPEDEVWDVVKDIFRNSRLTPFWYIIKQWEKKYALGFWMVDENGRKFKRSKFIKEVGYPKFKAMWAQLFYWAPAIAPVSHISVKGEALPEKKWAAGKVRSITGTPLSSYVSSTIWNYFPNHMFAWETTPIKIGMPLNGYWLSKVFARHSKFEHHCEGDMTAFDSTVQGPVIDLIRAVRKRGYDLHKDKDAIGDLIDICYKQLDSQANGFTSTGNIYDKGSGLSTGHSSTSMDNSVALVILYLMAWKELTGLTSREFRCFNELSNFGDDHILSYSAVRPLGWTVKNIEKTMAKWGVINRISTKPITELTFLSKHCRRPTLSEREEFIGTGVSCPEFIIVHDRAKLLGKIVAPILNLQSSYRLKRALSYLSLTAHHRSLYDDIVASILESKTLSAELEASGKKIPSYNTILKQWYSTRVPKQVAEVEEEISGPEGDSSNLVIYGSTTLLDDLLNALSMVPDFVNPQMFNLGYMNVLQRRLGQSVKWPLVLLTKSNQAVTIGALASTIQRSAYRFLDSSGQFGVLPEINTSTLLVRHWLFLLYCRWAPFNTGGNMFSFVANKLANLNFVINGHLMDNVVPFNLAIDKLVVVAVLDYIVVPDWISSVSAVRLPDIALMLDLAFNKAMSMIWSSVPSNYNEVGHIIRNSANHSKLLVSAPTGTGKSTSLIAYLAQVFGGDYTKIIVIEPRTLLVHGLVMYMNLNFGPMYSGSTTGLQLDERAKVWYMTPESLFARNFKVPEGSLLVLDEAHLQENSYALLLNLGSKLFLKTVCVTATPNSTLINWCDLHTSVPIASLWDRRDTNNLLGSAVMSLASKEYMASMSELVRLWPPNKRLLVVVDSPFHAEKLAGICPHRSQCLSSEHSPVIDRSAICYFGTSVVDVGVTIPDLDQIHFPNWVFLGKEKGHMALDDITEKQRRGRVGRTRNGDSIMWVAPVQLPPAPQAKLIDVDCFQHFMLQGVSPLFLSKVNLNTCLEAIGARVESLDQSDKAFLLRDAHTFLSNLAPLILAANVREHDTGVIHGGAGQLAPEAKLTPSEITNVVKSGLYFITESFDASMFPVSDSDKSLMEQCIVDASSRASTRFNIGWLLDHLAEAESSSEDEDESDSNSGSVSDSASESDLASHSSNEEGVDLLNPEGESPFEALEYLRIVQLLMKF